MLKTGGKKLEEINEFMSRVLPRFAKINPEISKDTLTRTFSITDIDGVKCPANSLSDGNVKLLALLVGVLSRKRSTSIIEEPENYLHPWAAQYLIEYFREHFSSGVCVITTHSETILNSVKPDEIVVVENQDGVTKQRRLSNKNELVKAIKVSGFGCGYHYLAGSLGGTS
jgi:predicted ATPase